MRFLDGQRSQVEELRAPEAMAQPENATTELSSDLELQIAELVKDHRESERASRKLSRIHSFFLAQLTAVAGFWAAVVPFSMAQIGRSFQDLGFIASVGLIASSYLYIVVNPAIPVYQTSYGWRVRRRSGREMHIMLLTPTPQEKVAIETSERLIAEDSRIAAQATLDTRRFERDARRLRRKSERFVRRGGL